jgi:cytoskeletal protein CcmA (bactofilin family)
MALFGQDDDGGSTTARSSSGDALPDQINMVGEGTVFEGTLRAESNVRVSGHIKGKLDVEGRAIVTQEGVVEGELHATDADVAGSMQGEIHVAERLMLKSTARIDGTIEAGRIKVEEGALFAGECRIGDDVSETVQQQIEAKSAGGSGARSSSAAGGASSPGASRDESRGASADQPAAPDSRRKAGDASQTTPAEKASSNSASSNSASS